MKHKIPWRETKEILKAWMVGSLLIKQFRLNFHIWSHSRLHQELHSNSLSTNQEIFSYLTFNCILTRRVCLVECFIHFWCLWHFHLDRISFRQSCYRISWKINEDNELENWNSFQTKMFFSPKVLENPFFSAIDCRFDVNSIDDMKSIYSRKAHVSHRI